MKCRKARKLIFDFIDGMLSDADKAGLEAHLAECRSCEAHAASIRESLSLLHSLPAERPSENFNWKLRLKLAQARKDLEERLEEQGRWIKRWNVRFALSAAASFAVVLAAGYFFVNSHLISPPGTAETATSGAASHVRVGRPVTLSEGPRLREERVRSYPGRVMEKVVSQGYPSRGGGVESYQPIGEAGRIVLDPDSVITVNLREMRLRYRMKYLEEQVKMLQRYLRRCQEQRK
jgi:hypothetical protein